MKSRGMTIASEGKQRSLMKAQLSEMEIQGGSVPFSFKSRSGPQELRPAPLVFIIDMKTMLFHLLNEKQRFIDNNCMHP